MSSSENTIELSSISSTHDSDNELQSKTQPDDGCHETRWRLVLAASIINFLCALESTASGMAEWPYMTTIDPKATSQFFGVVSSVSKVGHAVFAIVFSLLQISQCQVCPRYYLRIPLVIGRVLAFLGCILYLCVEFIPSNRRYIMMVCYFIFGIATSSTAVLRMFIVEISTTADRGRAYASMGLANMMSIVVGPIIQICFSGLKYPGKQLIPNVRFHIFSAPIWIAAFVNIVSIVAVIVVLKPLGNKTKTKEQAWSFSSLKLLNINEKIKYLHSSNVAWLLVVICWVGKLGIQLSATTQQTVMGPFAMMAFNFSPEQTTLVFAICMGAVGLISFAIAGALMTPWIGKRVSPRWVFLFALSISMVVYILSYPYPFTSHPIDAYNATTHTGCNSNEYSWCEGAIATTQFLFFPVTMLVMSVGMPLGIISLDTMYSKIFGTMDQTVMQGAMVAVEDIIQITGPLYASWVFTTWGQGVLWIVTGILTIVAILVWLVGIPRMKNFK